MDKKWYQSKGVWLGVFTCTIGLLEAAQRLIETGDFSLPAIIVAIIGVLKVWERVVRDGSSNIT